MDFTDTSIRLPEQLAAASAALSAVSSDVIEYRAVDDAMLLALNCSSADVLRLAQATAALIAGEIARRSAPGLGQNGLVQRLGHRTPEQFMKKSTGATGQQAVTAVRVGRMVQDAADAGVVDVSTGEITAAVEPWLAPVAAAIVAGPMTTSAAEAIARGLGQPTPGVSEGDLLVAARALCAEAAAGVDPDLLFRRARQLRDEIDVDGIGEREAERRKQRSLTFVQLPSGMSRLTWVMDPETAATVKDLYDRATSPKLGGVRFVDPDQSTLAEAIRADDRTPAQLASDAFEQLLRAGADVGGIGRVGGAGGAGGHGSAGAGAGAGAGSGSGSGSGSAPRAGILLGSGAPVIHIAATRSAVERRRGAAYIRGQADPVSIETLERLVCAGSHRETGFDPAGIPLDRGRDQRLFTAKQKQVLALRWGGCVHPGCERPPSWTEAHHIDHWVRDHGKSDIADGVLLCKHHHLLHHNKRWEIRRDEGGRYWLIPPTEVDAAQAPIELHGNSRVMRELAREEQYA
jgi:hypothetical protein